MTSDNGITLRERQAERVREELRTQFIRLVIERGPDGFTFQDLADAAGVSKRTLYRYYPNREAIIEAVFANEAAQFERELVSRAGAMTEFDTNPDLAADTFMVFENHADLAQLLKILRLRGLDGRTSDERTQLTRQLVAASDGVEPGVVDQLAGVIRLLLSTESWARLREPDIGLDAREAGYAVHWAALVLLRAAAGLEGPLRPGVSEQASARPGARTRHR